MAPLHLATGFGYYPNRNVMDAFGYGTTELMVVGKYPKYDYHGY